MTALIPSTIHHAIVHNLDKVAGQREASVRLGRSALPVTPALQRLVNAVHVAYEERVGKSYGAFEADAELHPAQTHIGKVSRADGPGFVAITGQLMAILAQRAKTEIFATGGHVLMIESGRGAARWFLVAMLTDIAGAAIDQNLNVVETNHLDLSAMRFAGRVNLTDWAAAGERYISFLRGRKAEVSGYFQEFLGCSTIIKPMVETQHLVKEIKRFAENQNLPESRREQLLHETDAFARACIKEGRPLELEALANRVWPDDPAILKTSFAQADPPIADGFQPDGRALKGLRKFSARAQNWKLEFDRDAMIDQTISFDREAGTLTIHHLPDDVRAQLAAEFRNDNEAQEPAA